MHLKKIIKNLTSFLFLTSILDKTEMLNLSNAKEAFPVHSFVSQKD